MVQHLFSLSFENPNSCAHKKLMANSKTDQIVQQWVVAYAVWKILTKEDTAFKRKKIIFPCNYLTH